MNTAYINIGSNIGDRRAAIARAVTAIKEQLDPLAVVSPEVHSEPWGYSSPHPYINVGVALRTTLEPVALLDKLLAIQDSISVASHRTADGDYADRIIDIDLIAVDSIVLSTTRLTLPHPRMHLRDFVLIPMAFLAPEWIHPVFNKSAPELLGNL
ncbi:MAG: 2-amino-4-hydroxy-6-hydroxymethyldihydropteridine diphosphokinase [Muribaculaceae bacterium]|nr:2-amino-4-hydroxy-6-hydroxymethyldihydropteridine diphosphokinase [Muribaculaceae bacterium]